MSFLNYLSHLKVLLKNHKSCSLVNADGALLYSKDQTPELLTTTRLVAFQIVKKYLRPKPHDLFILNDPENGGYQFSKIVFISCLDPNLFLIWDEDYFHLDFKIPPTPLYDEGVKNDFVWQALVSPHKYADELESFFVYHKYQIDQILKQRGPLSYIATQKNQQVWLKATQEIFNIQFNNKAHGSFESQFKLPQGQFIKLKLSAEEKQNLKLITLDFTNTNMANEIHTASHVIESALVKKLIDYYQIGEYFTQAILDKIKIILPPRSIVSKPHAIGEGCFELQMIGSQLCDFNLHQLNSHSRKAHSQFEFSNFLNFEIYNDDCFSQNLISQQSTVFSQFEELITAGLIKIKKMKRAENCSHLVFQVTCDGPLNLKIKNFGETSKTTQFLKLNNAVIPRGTYLLKKEDTVEVVYNGG